MVSDHVVITPDVAEQYPAPFYEPFTTLSWLAGVTGGSARHGPDRAVPASAAGRPDGGELDQLSGGRLVLGVASGWARQEFEALGVPFEQRSRLTDELLRTVRAAWRDDADYRAGTSRCGSAATARPGCAARSDSATWHPLRLTPAGHRSGADRLKAIAGELGRGTGVRPADRAAAHRVAGHHFRTAGRRGHDRAGRG